MRDYLTELIQGIVAIVLIGADVALVVSGHSDAVLSSAVPIIVAFYFGGRVTIAAVKQTQNGMASGGSKT